MLVLKQFLIKMNEQIRVLMPIQVAGLDKEVDIFKIEEDLNVYARARGQYLNLEILDGWRLTISLVSRPTNAIGVFKRSQKYPSDREFVLSASIPIPNDDEAEYGLKAVRESYYLPLDEGKFHILEPKYSDFKSMTEYIRHSGRRAIDAAFSVGVVINGKKLLSQS